MNIFIILFILLLLTLYIKNYLFITRTKGQPSSSSANYPTAFEDDPGNDWPELNSGELIKEIWGDRTRNSILAIEKTLGLSPEGNLNTLNERIQKSINSDGKLQLEGDGNISSAPDPSLNNFRFYVDSQNDPMAVYVSLDKNGIFQWQRLVTNANGLLDSVSITSGNKISLNGNNGNSFLRFLQTPNPRIQLYVNNKLQCEFQVDQFNVKDKINLTGSYFSPSGIGNGIYQNFIAAVPLIKGIAVIPGATLGEVVTANTSDGICPIGVTVSDASIGESVKVCISGIAKVLAHSASIGKSLLVYNSSGNSADIGNIYNPTFTEYSNGYEVISPVELLIRNITTISRRGVVGTSYQNLNFTASPQEIWAQINPGITTGTISQEILILEV